MQWEWLLRETLHCPLVQLQQYFMAILTPDLMLSRLLVSVHFDISYIDMYKVYIYWFHKLISITVFILCNR